MNPFEEDFFSKYIPEWQEIMWVIHKHFISIAPRLILLLSFWVLLPSFFYYYSFSLKQLIPFFVLEIYLFLVYIKIVYDVFDWYNDVWIVTDKSVIELEWSLFKKNVVSVWFENIEWLEVEKNWVADTILKKWEIIIHKIWDDVFALEEAYKPELAISYIEECISDFKEGSHKPDRFDVMMDHLWWMVEEYLDRQRIKEMEESNFKYEKIWSVEWKNETIDLR